MRMFYSKSLIIFNKLKIHITYVQFLMFIFVVLIISICVGSAYYVDGLENQSTKTILNSIIAMLINISSSLVILFLGFEKFKSVLDRELHKSSYGKLYELWYGGIGNRKYFLFYGGSLGTFREKENHTSSLATAYSIQVIKSCLVDKMRVAERILHKSIEENINLSDIENNNIILLGGISSLEYKSFFLKKNFPCLFIEQHVSGDDRSICFVDEGSEFKTKTIFNNDRKIIRDVAIITIARDIYGLNLYWINGNFGLGTYASVLFLTGSMYDHKFISLPDNGKFVQFAIEVTNIVDEQLSEEHRAISLTKFNDYRPRCLPENFSVSSFILELQADRMNVPPHQ